MSNLEYGVFCLEMVSVMQSAVCSDSANGEHVLNTWAILCHCRLRRIGVHGQRWLGREYIDRLRGREITYRCGYSARFPFLLLTRQSTINQ